MQDSGADEAAIEGNIEGDSCLGQFGPIHDVRVKWAHKAYRVESARFPKERQGVDRNSRQPAAPGESVLKGTIEDVPWLKPRKLMPQVFNFVRAEEQVHQGPVLLPVRKIGFHGERLPCKIWKTEEAEPREILSVMA